MSTQAITLIKTRPATASDIPFLAQVIYEASLPPHNQSFWDELLQHSQTSTLDFLAAMLEARASNWGQAEDFVIVEAEGRPVAAAAGYEPSLEDYQPIARSRIPAIAQALNWSTAAAAAFEQSDLQLFGPDPRPAFFCPQAPWQIESVAVLPDARGKGIGKMLLRSLLKRGQDQGLSHAGIAVINGNERAQKMYESLGFEPYQAFHRSYFLKQFGVDFPGVTKFICPLGPSEQEQKSSHG